jgi:hypothetical protein
MEGVGRVEVEMAEGAMVVVVVDVAGKLTLLVRGC